MKILILLAYYERYNMVRMALESIKNQSYSNWELAFCDDGSIEPGKPVVEKILNNDLHKVRFYNTNDSVEQKRKNGGSRHGAMLNDAMNQSDADIAIILCDDDILFPRYLELLNNFYTKNLNNYSYCHVSVYNPLQISEYSDIKINIYNSYNHTADINPVNRVDASQVSWRLKEAKKNNIGFPSIKTSNLDADFYSKLYENFGLCSFNGIIGQHKGIHEDQLYNRPYREYEIRDR